MRRLNQAVRAFQSLAAPKVRPVILRTLHHDKAAFTQGLAFHEGRLFESCGGDETSSLREVDPSNGQVMRKVAVRKDFAEGICVHAGFIYQLMWQSGRVLRYEVDTFSVASEHRISHEGWGIASSGQDLWVSDGSSLLRQYQPDMRLRETRRARSGLLPLRHLNSLSAANGRLYANIWYTDLIAEIDPASGKLMRFVDCSELTRIESPKTAHHVQNGIGYDESHGTFYLTGKHWANCFEVRIPD